MTSVLVSSASGVGKRPHLLSHDLVRYPDVDRMATLPGDHVLHSAWVGNTLCTVAAFQRNNLELAACWMNSHHGGANHQIKPYQYENHERLMSQFTTSLW